MSAHHTNMYISAVHVTDSYLQSCFEGFLKEQDYFIVRRSKTWDLAIPESRVEAAMTFLSVLSYTMSE